MALLKNMDTGEHITRFVSLSVTQEVIRTTQELLSGAVYINVCLHIVGFIDNPY